MDNWLAGRRLDDALLPERVKILRELSRLYLRDPESPYHDLTYKTQTSYSWYLGHLDKVVGDRRLDRLNGLDFRRWYNQFKKPKRTDIAEEYKTEHVAVAHGFITVLRVLFSFGVQWGVPEAKRLRDTLHEMKFRNSQARTQYMTYEMTVAFIEKAHELGHHEMAIAQALQFELMLRQTDVIGKWEPREDSSSEMKWVSGLLWQQIDENRILAHTPSKTMYTTNQQVVLDLKEYPLVVAELDRLSDVPRIGPIIVDSKTGQPFLYNHYHYLWRKIASAAGIPENIWNRDSRAGGVTEGGDAGADIEDLRHHAAHANIQTTQRYNRRTLTKTRRVARARVAHRNESGTT